MRKPIQKKTGNESDVNISEMDQKYSEISQYFSVFEGFPIILEKRTKRTKSHFLIRFCVGPFPFWGVSIAPLGAPREYEYHFLYLIGMKNVHAKLEINIELLKQDSIFGSLSVNCYRKMLFIFNMFRLFTKHLSNSKGGGWLSPKTPLLSAPDDTSK